MVKCASESVVGSAIVGAIEGAIDISIFEGCENTGNFSHIAAKQGAERGTNIEIGRRIAKQSRQSLHARPQSQPNCSPIVNRRLIRAQRCGQFCKQAR